MCILAHAPKDKIEFEVMQTWAMMKRAAGGRAQKSKKDLQEMSMKLRMTMKSKIRNVTSPVPAGQESEVHINYHCAACFK